MIVLCAGSAIQSGLTVSVVKFITELVKGGTMFEMPFVLAFLVILLAISGVS